MFEGARLVAEEGGHGVYFAGRVCLRATYPGLSSVVIEIYGEERAGFLVPTIDSLLGQRQGLVCSH